MEKNIISGIAFQRNEARITLSNIEDRPGVAAKIFGPLAEAGINVDMIVQSSSETGNTDLTFSCSAEEVEQAKEAIAKAKDLTYKNIIVNNEVAKVSIVGIGMKTHAGVAQKMFETLSQENINIHVISTSEIKVSVLIERKYLELAVRSLHDSFELEKI